MKGLWLAVYLFWELSSYTTKQFFSRIVNFCCTRGLSVDIAKEIFLGAILQEDCFVFVNVRFFCPYYQRKWFLILRWNRKKKKRHLEFHAFTTEKRSNIATEHRIWNTILDLITCPSKHTSWVFLRHIVISAHIFY